MKYLENHLDKREDPSLLVPGTKSIIVVLFNYYQIPDDNKKLKVSKYAHGNDYHKVIKDKLNQLLLYIKTRFPAAEGRVFTDSAPVFEKTLAVNAGLGWIGKNTCLISPGLGSFTFIGEIFINLDLVPDAPFVKNHCGNCSRCLQACPTAAIAKPFEIDAWKCISYQTIENKKDIDKELLEKFDSQVFGCDICQDACPWNQKLTSTTDAGFLREFHPGNIPDHFWKSPDKNTYLKHCKNTAVERAGMDKLLANYLFLSRQKNE